MSEWQRLTVKAASTGFLAAFSVTLWLDGHEFTACLAALLTMLLTVEALTAKQEGTPHA